MRNDAGIQRLLFDPRPFDPETITMWGRECSLVEAFSNYTGLFTNLNLTVVQTVERKENVPEHRAWVRGSRQYRIYRPVHLRLERSGQRRSYFYFKGFWREHLGDFFRKHESIIQKFRTGKKTKGIYEKSIKDMDLLTEFTKAAEQCCRQLHGGFNRAIYDFGVELLTPNPAFNNDLIEVHRKIGRVSIPRETERLVAQMDAWTPRLPAHQCKYMVFFKRTLYDRLGHEHVDQRYLNEVTALTTVFNVNHDEVSNMNNFAIHCEHLCDYKHCNDHSKYPHEPENCYFTSLEVNLSSLPRWKDKDSGIAKCKTLIGLGLFRRNDLIERLLQLCNVWSWDELRDVASAI